MDERHRSQTGFAPGNSGDAGAAGAYGTPGTFGTAGAYGVPGPSGGYGLAPSAPGFPPGGYGQQAYEGAAGYPSGGFGIPLYGAPGLPPGFPPGLAPPGYNPWLGTFAGPRYASVWARIAAYFIDSLVLGVVNVVAYLAVIVATTTTDQAGAPSVPPMAMLAAIILVLVLDGIYFVAQEGTSGQTLGKRVVGTRVVKADGSEMSVDAALVRYLFLLLAGLGLGGLITVVMISLSDTKQRIGDRVAGTIVVKTG